MPLNSADNLHTASHLAATIWAERPALTFGDATLTYEQLGETVARVAAGLKQLDIGPSSRVAILMPNCPEFVITYIAVVANGATVVPMPPLLGVAEVTYVLSDVEADALVVSEQLVPVGAAAVRHSRCVKHLIVSGDGAEEATALLADLMACDQPLLEPVDTDPDTPAVIIYTSGTTGRAKGAILTHGNLLANVNSCRQVIEVSSDDVFVTVLPLFHSFGATACMLLPMLSGCHNVILPGFSAMQTLEAITRWSASLFIGVPTMFALMMQVKDPGAYDLSSLRCGFSGGAALPDDVCHGFEELYGVPLIEGYGPTEASPVVSVNPLDGTRKVGSVGLPVPGVEVMIADDDGQPLATDEVGEVLVRGPNVMAGYHRANQLTRETLVKGWLCTGDLGKLDEDGYLYIVDRKKDLVIVGGVNVYPREVEDCIALMPQVAEVAVVGIPNRLRGELVAAHIVLHESQECTAEDVIGHCRQHLAPYKVPKEVHFTSELPKSAIGKVLKHELRAGSATD